MGQNILVRLQGKFVMFCYKKSKTKELGGFIIKIMN